MMRALTPPRSGPMTLQEKHEALLKGARYTLPGNSPSGSYETSILATPSCSVKINYP